MARPLLLLHLSDLHFGPHSRFQGRDFTKIGRSFHAALEEAKKQLGIDASMDLVIVTGDIAESGHPKQFKSGKEFLTALAGGFGLDHRRFVFVPGNHDLFWDDCTQVDLNRNLADPEWTDEEYRQRLDRAKLQRYEAFVKDFLGIQDFIEVATRLGCGAHLYNFPDLHLSVAALNSCEKESHRPEDHVGHISREQAEGVMAAWRIGNAAEMLKVVAVHHNPVVTTKENVEVWRKWLTEESQISKDLIARYEGDVLGFEGHQRLRNVAEDCRVQLLLHGHHHAKDEQIWGWKRDKGATHVLSAGSLSGGGQAPWARARLHPPDPSGPGKRRDAELVLDLRRSRANPRRGRIGSLRTRPRRTGRLLPTPGSSRGVSEVCADPEAEGIRRLLPHCRLSSDLPAELHALVLPLGSRTRRCYPSGRSEPPHRSHSRRHVPAAPLGGRLRHHRNQAGRPDQAREAALPEEASGDPGSGRGREDHVDALDLPQAS